MKYKICYRNACPKNDEKEHECADFNAWTTCLRCITQKPEDIKKEMNQVLERLKTQYPDIFDKIKNGKLKG